MKPRWAHQSRLERVLASWYPFGLAKKSLQPKAGGTARCPRVLFVASGSSPTLRSDDVSFIGEQGELLAKAVTQGLKWNLSEAALLYSSEIGDQAQFVELLKVLNPICIVILGDEARKVIVADRFSGWITHHGRLFFQAVDVREVLKSAAVKREFWRELKLVEERIATDE